MKVKVVRAFLVLLAGFDSETIKAPGGVGGGAIPPHPGPLQEESEFVG